jgi:mannosyltransferase
VGIASAAAVFYRLGFSVWFDEADSWGLSTQPLRMVINRYFLGTEVNMVLYYLLLRVWLWVTGLVGVAPTEIVLRLPSALFAVATSVVVYLLGRRLFGRIAGLVAAGVYIANYLQIIMAQMARAYTLQLLLLAIAWYALFAGLQEGTRRRRWWAVLAISSALAVYAQLFSVLVLASMFAGVLVMAAIPGHWSALVRANAKALLVSVGAVLVLIIPIGIDAAVHGGPVWVPPAHLSDVRAFFYMLAGNSRLYERVVVVVVGLGVLVAAVRQLRVSPHPALPREQGRETDVLAPVAAIACWFVGPLLLSFALTRPSLNLHLFFPRYLVVIVPPMALLVGMGVTALRWRAVQLGLAAAVAVVAIPALASYYQYAQVQDFRGLTQWVQARYQAGDGVVCAPEVECGVPTSYYFSAYPGPAHFDGDSPGRFLWERTASIPLSDENLTAYAAQHRRLFLLYGPLGVSPDRTTELDRVKATLAKHFQLIESVTAKGSAVDLMAYLYVPRGP